MNKLIGYGVIGLVAWTIVSGSCAPAPTLKDKTPITVAPTQFKWGWKGSDDAAGQITLTNRSTGEPLGDYAVGSDGMWHQTDEQRDNGVVAANYRPTLYLGQWNLDVGPIAGVPFNATLDDDIQLGIRLSPARLAFGTVAPDVTATREAGGLGLSFYPPERAVGRTLAHFGVGAWYMAPWDGGRPGLVLGLSASTNP